MDARLAWIIGLASMLAVLLVAGALRAPPRLALVYALLWGKLVAGVYWALGIDVPLFTVYYYSNGVLHRIATVSANMLIFISFLSTNLLAVIWPRVARELRLPSSL